MLNKCKQRSLYANPEQNEKKGKSFKCKFIYVANNFGVSVGFESFLIFHSRYPPISILQVHLFYSFLFYSFCVLYVRAELLCVYMI